MVEAVNTKSLLDLPASERPLDFQHISYYPKNNKTDTSWEVVVKMTLYFGKRDGREFSGETKYAYSRDEIAVAEANSFINVAQEVWKEFRRRDGVKVNFIEGFLTQKWNDLNGEKLTSTKLHFDRNSDNIICNDCPKKR